MRFRFTIRDLLWLAVVVALAVGWYVDHNRRFEQIFSRYLMKGLHGQMEIIDLREDKAWIRDGDQWVDYPLPPLTAPK